LDSSSQINGIKRGFDASDAQDYRPSQPYCPTFDHSDPDELVSGIASSQITNNTPGTTSVMSRRTQTSTFSRPAQLKLQIVCDSAGKSGNCHLHTYVGEKKAASSRPIGRF